MSRAARPIIFPQLRLPLAFGGVVEDQAHGSGFELNRNWRARRGGWSIIGLGIVPRLRSVCIEPVTDAAFMEATVNGKHEQQYAAHQKGTSDEPTC